jgi:hypothetical protein
MASWRISSCSLQLLHSTQLHESQYLRAAKHSQYNLRHFDFLQLQVPLATLGDILDCLALASTAGLENGRTDEEGVEVARLFLGRVAGAARDDVEWLGGGGRGVPPFIPCDWEELLLLLQL